MSNLGYALAKGVIFDSLARDNGYAEFYFHGQPMIVYLPPDPLD